MTGRLPGRRILVVGAGTRPSPEPDAPVGNGRAISVLAAREGANVACADVDEASAQATAELVAAEGTTAAVVVADVSDPEACAAMVEAAAAELGGLDGVVVNVGIGRGMDLAGTTTDDWDAVFAVNTRAHFLTCQAALPVLAEGSSIVLVSSVAGLRPGSRIPAYDASKAALAGLGRHVAMEGARQGVRVNVVCPGLIDTPLAGSPPRAGRAGPRRRCRWAARARRGRWPPPWCSFCPTTPATPPARSSPSTAASPWDDEQPANTPQRAGQPCAHVGLANTFRHTPT